MQTLQWIFFGVAVLGGVICMSVIPSFVRIKWILFGVGLLLVVGGTVLLVLESKVV